jgi:hypothetical protein
MNDRSSVPSARATPPACQSFFTAEIIVGLASALTMISR